MSKLSNEQILMIWSEATVVQNHFMTRQKKKELLLH